MQRERQTDRGRWTERERERKRFLDVVTEWIERRLCVQDIRSSIHGGVES